MAVYAESLPGLVEMGMKIPLAWAQEKLAIPLASDDEPVLALQTAESEGVKVAPLSYRRVALSRQGEILDMGQAAIDNAGLGKIALPEHIEPFLRGLGQALAEGDSYEEVQERLLRAYPHLDSTEFQTALARVIFISDLWGRLNG